MNLREAIKQYFKEIVIPVSKQFKTEFIVVVGLFVVVSLVRRVFETIDVSILKSAGIYSSLIFMDLIIYAIPISFFIILALLVGEFIVFISHSQTPSESQR